MILRILREHIVTIIVIELVLLLFVDPCAIVSNKHTIGGFNALTIHVPLWAIDILSCQWIPLLAQMSRSLVIR